MTQPEPYEPTGLRIRNLRGELSQTDFAAKIGVDRKSVAGWEAGKRLPDGFSFLRLMTEFGADVNYILSGTPSSSVPTVDAAEHVLLDSYRRCSNEARASLIQTAALLAAHVAPPQGERRKPVGRSATMRDINVGNMTNLAPGGVQVGAAAGVVTVVKGQPGRK